jgi:hypothetical protein
VLLATPFQRKKLCGIAEKCGNFSFNRENQAMGQEQRAK